MYVMNENDKEINIGYDENLYYIVKYDIKNRSIYRIVLLHFVWDMNRK